MCFAPRKPKTTVFTMLFAFTMFFLPVPSKNTGIYAVFTMLQDVISICENDNNSVSSSPVNRLKGATDVAVWLQGGNQTAVPKSQMGATPLTPGVGNLVQRSKDLGSFGDNCCW